MPAKVEADLETKEKVKNGINAILLGPPGSGKGTQVSTWSIIFSSFNIKTLY